VANDEFLQEIEDTKYWKSLDKFCFSDGRTINTHLWINDAFDDSKDPFKNVTDGVFYFTVRSNSRLIDIEHFFRTLFIKIATAELVEISTEDIVFPGLNKSRGLRVYITEFNIYNPSYWGENLTKLAYYILTLATIIDFPISGEQMSGESLSNALFEVYNLDVKLNPDRFFHRGMAELFNVLMVRRSDPEKARSMLTDGPRLVSGDMENLSLVLQSRDDLNAVLGRVKEFNSEKITDEALIQYETMRRHF